MNKIIKKIKYTEKDINIVISFSNKFYDIGLFQNTDIESDEEIGFNEINTITTPGISRLNELRKYSESNVISEKYLVSINNSNGVILAETDETKITYIIDGIKFIDNLENGDTDLIYNTPSSYNDIDNLTVYKDDRYLNYTDYKEKRDLDITRQSLNIFESHIRLTDIKNVEELILYGGGYYNIIKNS